MSRCVFRVCFVTVKNFVTEKKKEISTKIKHTHTTTPQYTKRKSVVRNDSTQSNLLVVLTTIRGERYHLYFVFSSLFSFPETNFFLLVNFSFFRIIHPVTSRVPLPFSLSLSRSFRARASVFEQSECLEKHFSDLVKHENSAGGPSTFFLLFL